MPFRLGEGRTKIQVLTSSETPMLIHDACVKYGIPSQNRYVQLAIAEALSRDLDIDLEDLMANLPPTRGEVDNPLLRPRGIGPANTVEEVR